MLQLSKRLLEPSFIIEFVQVIVVVAVALALALDMTGIWSGIPWLSNNLSSITFIAICLLIVSVFIEKRFYLDNFSSKITQKLDKVIEANSPGIKLQDRRELSIPFETRLANAQNVFLMANTLVGIVAHFEGFILAKAKAGCKFRIILLDPNYSYMTGENPKPWKGKSNRKMNIEHAVRILEFLQKQTDNIEIRFLPVPGAFSLIAIDPERAYGEVQVELYAFDPSPSNRPHFVLTRSNNSKWYEFFAQQFEEAWQISRIPNSIVQTVSVSKQS